MVEKEKRKQQEQKRTNNNIKYKLEHVEETRKAILSQNMMF